MPQDIPFTWSEDENMLYFVLQVRGAKQKAVDVSLCDIYVKINCRPQLFTVDLCREIEPDHKQTMCKIGGNKISLSLKKRKPGLWHDFRAVGSKEELKQRRTAALEAAAEHETERHKLKDDRKHEMIKAAEHEQWRLDRENREKIEQWEAEEKAKWEDELLSGFDEMGKLKENGGDAAPALDDEDMDLPDVEESVPAPKPAEVPKPAPKTQINPEKMRDFPDKELPQVCEVTDEEAAIIRAKKLEPAVSEDTSAKARAAADKDAIWTQKDLNKDPLAGDDYEEYMPDVRENPGKIGMRFSMRPRAGVPVRDTGRREPPHPKNMVKSDLPPMIAGDRDQDEEDPVWLKDKADHLMVSGDYQGAYNAYTEALKLGIHANAFANRALADMYLGNLEQCVEDCNRAIAIIDKRNKPPAGHSHMGATDPQDQVVRVRCEVRIGTAFLWLGAFKKAEEHFQKALDSEEGLDLAERKKLKEDLARVQNSRSALILKEKADGAARRAHGTEDLVQKELGGALEAYEEALKADAESAVVYANRCFANLRAGHLEQCVKDADTAVELLKQWPIARGAPKAPERPARLDPPMLDDPTFTHPDEKKQGEVDWLMKHSGGDTSNLPELPPEYEWVKDVAEKNDNAWIAIRRKRSKAVMDAIRDSTKELQEVLYVRNVRAIRSQVEVAIDLNKCGEGPSAKAIGQARDFAAKIEAFEEEQKADRERQELELRKEAEDYDLVAALDPKRTGVAKAGFVRSNPVEVTQRRLFAKVLLRRARAHELLGDLEASASDLGVVRRIEPENREAAQRLKGVEIALAPQPEIPAVASTAPVVSAGGPGDEAGGSPAPSAVAGLGQVKPTVASAAPVEPAVGPNKTSTVRQSRDAAIASELGECDEEDEVFDHSAAAQLLQSAADYMRRNDYQGALQIYNYLRRRCKEWESPLIELKVLSNTSLCLQRLRGRLPELVKACSEALQRIAELRVESPDAVPQDMLLNMECAVLSRRGNAYSQQQNQEESNRDAARVRELLGKPA